MAFEELKDFLENKMRMSHIYQPVMIKHLLKNEGQSIDKSIAEEIMQYDPSQIEYYQAIVNNMVGKVLRNREVVTKEKNIYHLNQFKHLSPIEIEALIELCNTKIQNYLEKRGEDIWKHRTKTRTPISGSIRYEVFKRAKFRCELCGISAGEKALEVDHIVPVNLGGEDSINNYQALCYSCNATKRDLDKTDFRDNSHLYDCRDEKCVFCSLPSKRIVKENNLAIWIYDNYPVSPGHSLIIPKRHFSDYFDITQAELNAVNHLLRVAKDEIVAEDKKISAFNIGNNSGIEAGQTIFHFHTHLIPRRKNDVEDPRGGIRGVIPSSRIY